MGNIIGEEDELVYMFVME